MLLNQSVAGAPLCVIQAVQHSDICSAAQDQSLIPGLATSKHATDCRVRCLAILPIEQAV